VNRLSRNVDAVIDVERHPDTDEEPDFLPPLLERTLRRRGLSDTSIHSTFTNHGDEDRSHVLPPVSPQRRSFNTALSGLPVWPDHTSVFQALTRTMQNFRASTVGGIPGPSTPEPALDKDASMSTSPSKVSTVPVTPTDAQIPIQAPSTPSRRIIEPKPSRVASPNRGAILPSLASWAASNVAGDEPFIASSLRDESYMQRVGRGRTGIDENHTRDFY